MCAAGFRASIAASLLRAGGFDDVTWVDQGVPAWQAAGHRVETGADPGAAPPDRRARRTDDGPV